MHAALIIASREFRDGIRNRWVAGATVLMAGLALSLGFLGSAPTGTLGVGTLEVTVASLSSLTILLVPLIGLLLSFDTVVGEIERGTLLLLLTYPVSRPWILVGKFFGQVAILGFATGLGYGAAGAALVLAGGSDAGAGVPPFAAMIGSSLLLGAAFVALGTLISTMVGSRSTAAGAAIGVWLGLVVIYDLVLLGVLVLLEGRSLTPGLLTSLLLLNPTDSYRLFNLTGFAGVSILSGMAGLADTVRIAPGVLLGALAAWVVVPLGLAVALFEKREL